MLDSPFKKVNKGNMRNIFIKECSKRKAALINAISHKDPVTAVDCNIIL
jgi:hypothetical protein